MNQNRKVSKESVAAPCSEEIEHWLESAGVSYGGCFPIPLSAIDRQASRHNQAREQAIIPETVDRYVQALRNGDKFPPIVVYPRGEKYVIVDGNHRDESHRKANKREISAYVISKDTPSEIIELLTAEANSKHGEPTPTQWRTRQAIYLMSLGVDQDEVTVRLGLSKGTVNRAIRILRSDDRARRLKIQGWDTLTDRAKELLVAVRSDEAFAGAAGLIIGTNWSGATMVEFIRRVKAASTDKEAVELIPQAKEERAVELAREKVVGRDKAARISNPKMRVLSALGAILAVKPEELNRLFLSDDERKEVGRRCADASLRLMEMEEVLRGDSE